MKIYMGPYREWVGPYQIADKIFFWIDKYAADELLDRWDYRLHDRFGNWLAKDKNGNDSQLTRFCQWINEKAQRKIQVRIDNYDVWGMDHTLALIILPMLQKLKTQKTGYGFIDDNDVPAEVGIRSTDCPPPSSGSFWDDNAEKRFEWMMNELIWTFTQLADDDGGEAQFYDHTESNKIKDDINASIRALKVDRVGLEAHQKRIEHGLVLFGKYFRTLWD